MEDEIKHLMIIAILISILIQIYNAHSNKSTLFCSFQKSHLSVDFFGHTKSLSNFHPYKAG